MRTLMSCLSGTKEKGARDVLALLASSWVASLDKGCKIAVYCSDAAFFLFDRVSSKRPVVKLKAKGIDSRIIKVIES